MSADTISVTNGGSVTETGGSSGPSPPASPQELQAALTVTSVGGVTYTGAGIKVGVLSTSFNRTGGAATDTADGALPPASQVTVLQDAPSDIVGTGADDEGRALMHSPQTRGASPPCRRRSSRPRCRRTRPPGDPPA